MVLSPALILVPMWRIHMYMHVYARYVLCTQPVDPHPKFGIEKVQTLPRKLSPNAPDLTLQNHQNLHAKSSTPTKPSTVVHMCLQSSLDATHPRAAVERERGARHVCGGGAGEEEGCECVSRSVQSSLGRGGRVTG